MIKKHAELNSNQEKLIQKLLPGPFTLILKSKHKVSSLLESEKGTLGVRLPDSEFVTTLVKQFGKPLTATSANLSGRSAHYSIDSLLNELPESKRRLIDLIIDAGKLPKNKPSTVVDLTSPQLKIVRQGDIVSGDKKIARFILQKSFDFPQNKPLIFIIKGELGVGKTIFVKGIGEYFAITNIVSPTYVIYYEYKIKQVHLKGVNVKNKLVHIDLYDIQDPEEFKHLGLEKYLEKGNVLCFEWGEKAGEIMNELKSKGQIVYVDMKYVAKNKREIAVTE